MSVEMNVFLRADRLPTAQQWADAIVAAGFDAQLDRSVQLTTHTGYLPCRYGGKDSGFEYYRDDLEDVELDPEISEGVGDRDTVVSFVSHGDLRELTCAIIAAAVLTQLADGMYWDTEGDELYPAEGAVRQAREVEQDLLRELKAAVLRN